MMKSNYKRSADHHGRTQGVLAAPLGHTKDNHQEADDVDKADLNQDGYIDVDGLKQAFIERLNLIKTKSNREVLCIKCW